MARKAKTGAGTMSVSKQVVLAEFDVTALVGLKVTVCDAAYEKIDEDGEATIEVPDLRPLLASAAVARCLMPVRLRGGELRAMRKIMRLTLTGLAERLGEKTAPETISRWETEAQPIGGFAEKVIRLLVCDELHKEATGVSYDSSLIARIRIADPWITNKAFKVPVITFHRVKMREQSGAVIDVYNDNGHKAA